MTQENQERKRETTDEGTYKNSNTSQGGNNPSGYPTPDSPVKLAKGTILDEPDDPQAARPEAPYNTGDDK
ncbi:MAG: hypothetical protein ACJ73D_02370 [Pyrinomonadaceae bacterium]